MNKSWIIIISLLFIYTIGFVVFYPSIPTISDEAYYLLQAKLFSEGNITSAVINPETGEYIQKLGGHYPIGTSLFIAPFYYIFGFKGAYLLPLIMLILTVLVTAKWIFEQGYSPLFALFILGYPSCLVMGRIPMSGLPSAFLVGFGCWLFWRGIKGNEIYWFLSGFIAGVSLLFREMNPILFAPLFLGTLIRREKNCKYLIIGGIIGLSFRLLSSYVVFGDIFFIRTSQQTLETFRFDSTILINFILYPVALLIFIPGGILWSLSYKGERRFELITTVILFISILLIHETSAHFTSPAKAILNHTRLFIPLLPILVFQMAEVVPRFWNRLITKIRDAKFASHLSIGVIYLWLILLAVGSFGVHWGFSRWTENKVRLRDTIYENIPEGSVILTNRRSTIKYISPLFGNHIVREIRSLKESSIEKIIHGYGELYIVLHKRFDSEFWEQKNLENEKVVQSIYPVPILLIDEKISHEDKLLIWHVKRKKNK